MNRMRTLNRDQFARCEHISMWGHDGVTWKLYRVPRDVIDPDCMDDDAPAYYLVAIDSAGIQREEEIFDPLYDRIDNNHRLVARELAAECPEPYARDLLAEFANA